MLPHRSDTSRGHLHPPTRPRLSLPPSALSPSFFLLDVRLGLTSRGGFSRATAYAATFLGALAQASLSLPFPAITPSSQLPGPPRYPRYPSYRSKMQRPLSTRQIFSSPAQRILHPRSVARSGRLHDFWNFRSCDLGASTMAMVLERGLPHSLGARERRSREICPLAS